MSKTETFNATGGIQPWYCPPGVTSIFVTARGSAAQVGANAGYGALVTGTMATVPGDVYWFYVGGYGGIPVGNAGGVGGFNGGGAGGPTAGQATFGPGYGGGGATDIRHGGQALANRFFSAAGGAGQCGRTAFSAGGNAGGTTGTTGSGGNGGGGGTPSAGGAAGGAGGGIGVAGSLGQGGSGGGNSVQSGGGGGGGGFYGGGGGGATTGGLSPSGGGGGSSATTNGGLGLTGGSITAAYSAAGYASGNITIVYDLPPSAPALINPATDTYIALSSSYAFQWGYHDPDGDVHAASDLRYRAVGAAAWTTISNASTAAVASGATLSYSLAATLTAGVLYEWQVECKDSAGLQGAWSASSYFTPSTTPWVAPGTQPGAMELEIYDALTKAFITNVPQRLAPSVLEEFGSGGGTFTLRVNDPNLLANPSMLNFRNVVRVKINNQYVGDWVISGLKPTIVSTDEYAGLAIEVSGVGLEGTWFGDAVVYPENLSPWATTLANTLANPGGPTPTVRPFGWMSGRLQGHWYNSIAWQVPLANSTQVSVTAWNPATTTGNPWAGGPSGWPAGNTANWISWADTRGTLGDKNGFSYFRYEFETTINELMQFYITGDNAFVAYLDGVQIASSTSWVATTTSEVITVGPGMHTLAIELQQVGWTNASTTNPSALLVAAYNLADATSGATAGLAFDSSSPGWLCQGHPGVAPGWTMGDILITLFKESQNRGVSSHQFLGFGFDQNVDSYGQPWLADGSQWVFPVGMSYADVIDAVEAVGYDVWIDANFFLQCAPNRGIDRSSMFPNDTYNALIIRDAPTWFFPVSTAAGAVTGGTGWNDTMGSSTKMLAAVTGGTITYATAMPTPCALTGLILPALGGSLNAVPAFTIPAECSFEFWASVATIEEVRLLITDSATGNSMGIFYGELINSSNVAVPALQAATLIYTDNAQPTIEQAAYEATDNTPGHFVTRLQDDGASLRIQIYRNAVLLVDALGVSGGRYGTATLQLANLDALNPGTGATAAMSMAAVAFYSSYLTTDQILAHYKAGLGAFVDTAQPVIFSPGTSVMSADSDIECQVKTALMVTSQTALFEVRAAPAATAKYGRIEGAYSGTSSSTADARTIADATIESLISNVTSANLAILGGYTPFTDFGVGDWILAPPDIGSPDSASFDLVRRRVVSITATEDSDTRKVLYAIELDTVNQDQSQRLTKWLARISPQGSMGGLIPNVLS